MFNVREMKCVISFSLNDASDKVAMIIKGVRKKEYMIFVAVKKVGS